MSRSHAHNQGARKPRRHRGAGFSPTSRTMSKFRCFLADRRCVNGHPRERRRRAVMGFTRPRSVIQETNAEQPDERARHLPVDRRREPAAVPDRGGRCNDLWLTRLWRDAVREDPARARSSIHSNLRDRAGYLRCHHGGVVVWPVQCLAIPAIAGPGRRLFVYCVHNRRDLDVSWSVFTHRPARRRAADHLSFVHEFGTAGSRSQ